MKDGFEEMEDEFPFEIFHLGKQDYLKRCSVVPGMTHIVVFHFLCNRISRKIFVNDKQPD